MSNSAIGQIQYLWMISVIAQSANNLVCRAMKFILPCVISHHATNLK
uniref:Uncharacterized protein n=1 Tax=Lepeophtheirus salmonis TaxID=72036 RepID=A0A0K2UR00_LEPSM